MKPVIHFKITVFILLLCGLLIYGYYLTDRPAGPEPPAGNRKIEKTIPEPAPLSNMLYDRIPPPDGFERVGIQSGSFAEYLRNLTLKPGCPPVYLYNGQKKGNQLAHCAVFDMDVGTKDLQQCADAVIRLRAEYLYKAKRFKEIHFNFTSGDRADFVSWKDGFRPVVNGNTVIWKKKAAPDCSYSSFRKYLETVFMYAGTASLAGELATVKADEMKIGDVFIRGGFPGHAAIVVDMASRRGRKVFLLAQSYMPAQDIHILKNPFAPGISPWYHLDFGTELLTPEWRFSRSELCRFLKQR